MAQQQPNHYLQDNTLLTEQLRRVAQAQMALELTPDYSPQYRKLSTALVQEQYKLHRQLRILTMLAAYEDQGEAHEFRDHELRDSTPGGDAYGATTSTEISTL